MGALRGFAGGVVGGGMELVPGHQRDLGIDHQMPVARQVDHHVGLDTTIRGGVADLHVVMRALAKPRHLKHAAEHEFAPVAARLGRTLERLGEVLCIGAQRLVEAREFLDLLLERRTLQPLRSVDLLDLGLELVDLQAQRLQQGLQPGLALLRKGLRALLEHLLCQHLETGGEFGAHLVELRQRRLMPLPLRLKVGGGLVAGGLQLGGRARALVQQQPLAARALISQLRRGTLPIGSQFARSPLTLGVEVALQPRCLGDALLLRGFETRLQCSCALATASTRGEPARHRSERGSDQHGDQGNVFHRPASSMLRTAVCRHRWLTT